MQLHNDPLAILNLNNNQFIHLGDEPDDGSLLLASLMARKVCGPLPIPKLGTVEIQADLGEHVALLHLQIDSKATCWATFVTGASDPKQNWREAHAFHRKLLGRCRPPQPHLPASAMPDGPWMTLTFFPCCLAVLSSEQISLTVAALWGITWELRRLAWPAATQK